MFVYAGSRHAGVRAGTIQRSFRDLHAGTQHFTSSPPVRQACGRMLAGVAPGQDVAVPVADRRASELTGPR